jgi:putative DNA primase/helicase
MTLAEFAAVTRNGTWKALVDAVRAACDVDDAERFTRLKESLPGITPAGIFTRAANDGFVEASGLVQIDLDKLPDPVALREKLQADSYVACAFLSPSGRGVKAFVRCIPLVAHPRTYKQKAWAPVAAYVQRTYDVHVDEDGVSCKQLAFVSFDPDAYLNPNPIAFELKDLGPDAWLATMGDHPAGMGCHDAMVRAAAAGAAVGMDREELKTAIENRMRAAFWTTTKRRKDILARIPEKVDAALDSAYANFQGKASASKRKARPQQPLRQAETLPLSDYTNALAFVEDHGTNVRYCHPWKKWLVWAETHWHCDASGAVMRQAKQTIRRLAASVEHIEDDLVARARLKHVKASLATHTLKAMVESAQSEPGIPVQPEELDSNPWLLNCLNGTLNLKTGILQPHARHDLLTCSIPVAYEATARCVMWKTFLDRIMAGNQSLIAFLQRAIGYALTGVIREHVLLILWGTGRNGKSTFLNTIRLLLGPYAMKAPSELLLVSNADRHPTERADLFGKRFVAAIETEQGRRLAEVFVKEATGGDPIRARRMREDFWEFQPTHKVFLATNHKPVITGTDNAIWERLRLVPFTVTIPSEARDTSLPEKLQAELPGILAWAVRGCLAWQAEGLGLPEEVQAATKAYRNDMDTLGQFIAECCVTGPNYRTKADKLYDAYTRWHGEQAKNQRAWGMALTERGFERKRGTGGYYWWIGIGLVETKGTVSKNQVNQVNHSEPRNGITREAILRDGNIRKVGSLGSLGSLPQDDDGSAEQAVEDEEEIGEWTA